MRRRTARPAMAALACASLALAGCGADEAAGGGDAASGEKSYRALCASCHGALGEGAVGPRLNDWSGTRSSLVETIATRMPPDDPSKCAGKCATDVAAYIMDELVKAASCDGVPYAPRALRLLTRREYNNTVRDLFRISGSLSCKADAECDVKRESCVASACAKDPCNLRTFVFAAGGKTHKSVHVAGDFNGWPGTLAAGGWPMQYVPGKDIYVAKHAVDNGKHQYKFVIDESQWVPDPANPDGTPDGFGGQNSALTVSCTAGEPPVSAGDAWNPGKDIPATSPPKGYVFDNNADAGIVTAVHVEQYMKAAEGLAKEALKSPGAVVPCDPASGKDACAASFAKSFGARAFRRPLTGDEVARYQKLVTSQGDFYAGVGVAIQVMLSSPYFLYRSELGAPAADGSFRLTPYETASALSYMFWGTMPDDALFAAAAAGELANAGGVEKQARRLLADARSRPVVSEFGVEWLGVDRLLTADKNPSMFPGFSDATRLSMIEETRRFVGHVVFDGSRKYQELLTADYTFANGELAALYGLPAPGGSGELVQVAGKPERKAGLLAQGSVLASYAYSDQSAPIRRGLFVRERLLCEELGQPPPNVPPVPKVDPNATTRDRFRAHAAGSCKTCHQYIDDLGFGFEHFDAIGRYRDTEGNGLPVDSAGNMNDVEQLGSMTSAPFSSVPELASILTKSDSAKACFARQYYRFALGHIESPREACAEKTLAEQFAASGFDIQELMIAITRAPGFLERK